MKANGTKESFIVAHLHSDATTPDADAGVLIESVFGSRARGSGRQGFLNFCQSKHYQWDDLRHAKHASTMVLYHVLAQGSVVARPPGAPPVLQSTVGGDLCRTATESTTSSTASSTESSTAHRASAGFRADRRKALLGARVRLVDHAAYCLNHKCKVPNCESMKRVLEHVSSCDQRQCPACRRARSWLQIHARLRRTNAVLRKFCPNATLPVDADRAATKAAARSEDDVIAHVALCADPHCSDADCVARKSTINHGRTCSAGPATCEVCAAAVPLAAAVREKRTQHHLYLVEHAACCDDDTCAVDRCNELKGLLRHCRTCPAPDKDLCDRCHLADGLVSTYLRHRPAPPTSVLAALPGCRPPPGG